MTMKSVEMHFKMIAVHAGGSAALLVLSAVYAPLAMAGVLLIGGHGVYKIYGKTLFGDDAAMMMLLPFSARELVIGKTAALLLWWGSLWLAAKAVSMLAIAGQSYEAAMSLRTEDLQLAGMTPLQAGISAGWSILSPVLYMAVLCLLILVLELKWAGGGRKKNSPLRLVLIEAAGFALSGMAAAGVTLLKALLVRLALGQAYFWLCMALELPVVLGGWYLYRLSVRQLERGYDLG